MAASRMRVLAPFASVPTSPSMIDSYFGLDAKLRLLRVAGRGVFHGVHLHDSLCMFPVVAPSFMDVLPSLISFDGIIPRGQSRRKHHQVVHPSYGPT